MLNIKTIVANEFFNKNGVWYSKNKSTVHYPEKGSELCIEIEDKSFWFKHRNNCIISVVKSFSKKKDIFLDIGGGNGFVSYKLQEHGYKPILIEPSISGVTNSKKRSINNVICSSFENIHFDKNSIDAIGLFDVIEHIEKDHLFLNKINLILKKNGKIYITVPAHQFLFSKEDSFAGHQRRYSLNSLKQVLDKSKFKVIYSTYYFSIFIIPILISRKIFYFFKKNNFDNFYEIINEHKQTSFLLNLIFKLLFKWELKRINELKKIPFGSSCLIVAEKNICKKI